jgi:hypothetical protein
VEWWDSKWIEDNIAPKLAGRESEEIAQSQYSARRPTRRSKRR